MPLENSWTSPDASRDLAMLWFTGSSTEGLPFIHDSFRANPKAVHHRPKPRRSSEGKGNASQPGEEKGRTSQQGRPLQPAEVKGKHAQPGDAKGSSDHSGINGVNASGHQGINGAATPLQVLTQRDISSEAVFDNETLRLPAIVVDSGRSNGQQSSRSDTSGHHKDYSFNGYIKRYKACARLKGISPSRVYCATRGKASLLEDAKKQAQNNDNDNHQINSNDSPNKDHISESSAPKDAKKQDPSNTNGHQHSSSSDSPNLISESSVPKDEFVVEPCADANNQQEGGYSSLALQTDKSKSPKVAFDFESSAENPSADASAVTAASSGVDAPDGSSGAAGTPAGSAGTAGAQPANGTPDRLPKVNFKENSLTTTTNMTVTVTPRSAQEPSEFEKRLDEKLKRGGSFDNGMKSSATTGRGLHGKGRGKGAGGKGGGGGGHSGRGGGGGVGGRPLGDIVSPKRLQELLDHGDERTLPYTYYRIAVEPNIEKAHPNSPQ